LWSIAFERLNLGVYKNLEETTMLEADSFHFSKSYKDILHFIYFKQLGMCALQKAFPFLFGDTLLKFSELLVSLPFGPKYHF
jgi:hypothetical protein